MSKQIIENNFKPYREKEYKLYLLWRSLPPLRNLDLKSFSQTEIELLSIKSQKEFAARYSLSEDILSDWNKLTITIEYRIFDWKFWAQRLTKNIIGALYREGIIYGDAARVKLWMEIVEDWQGSAPSDTRQNHKEIDELRDKLKEFIELPD